MRRYLKQLYSLSLSSLSCPIEYFVAAVVQCIPRPIDGGRPFHVVLDSGLVSSKSRTLSPIIFDRPPSRFFPPLDLDFSMPFRCLSLENITAVFALLLREAKIVFLCSSSTVLTETMEVLQSLLFPLVWSTCYVSRLPLSLAGMMGAPGGFMIGIEDAVVEPSMQANGASNSGANNGDRFWYHSITPGTYVIDLGRNCIAQHNGYIHEALPSSKVQAIIKTLPNGPRLRLMQKLTGIVQQCNIVLQNDNLDQFDSALDSQDSDMLLSPFPTLDVRDAFMVFMIDVLGNYEDYIKPPSRDITSDTFRTFRESFAVDEYIGSADSSMRTMLTLLTESQMFSVLLQQRFDGGSYGLSFYDRCSKVMSLLGLSAIGHGDRFSSSIPELPLPLYQLSTACDIYCQLYGPLSAVPKKNNHHEQSPSVTKGSNSPSFSPSFGLGLKLSPGIPGMGSNSNKGVDSSKKNESLSKIMMFVQKYNDLNINIFQENSEISSHHARDEVDSSTDLKLNDRNEGPLLLPGPSRPAVPFSSLINGNVEDGMIMYPDGWPSLSSEYLHVASSSINQNVVNIREARKYALEKVSYQSFSLFCEMK